MKKRTEAVVLTILVICFGTMLLNNSGLFDTDFTKTKLIYENDSDFRFYYDSLSENAKIAYTLILPELYKHEKKIEIPEITDSELDELMYALSYDNPDLICYGTECEIKYENRGFYFYPSYTHSQQDCESCSKQLDEAVKKALAGVDSSASDYEKELYVHDYVCSVCRYEITDEANLKITAFDALVDGEAVCEGYARATQLLLNELGIQNYLATGDAADKNGNVNGHMWNIVTIDGKNYHLDVTWDDMDEGDEFFTDCHMYFNVTDEFIMINHFNIQPADNNCLSTDMNYYSVNGMLFSTYSSSTLQAIKSKIYHNYLAEINSCEFRFTNVAAFNRAASELLEKEGVLDIMSQVESQFGDMTYTSVRYVVDNNVFVIKFVFS